MNRLKAMRFNPLVAWASIQRLVILNTALGLSAASRCLERAAQKLMKVGGCRNGDAQARHYDNARLSVRGVRHAIVERPKCNIDNAIRKSASQYSVGIFNVPEGQIDYLNRFDHGQIPCWGEEQMRALKGCAQMPGMTFSPKSRSKG